MILKFSKNCSLYLSYAALSISASGEVPAPEPGCIFVYGPVLATSPSLHGLVHFCGCGALLDVVFGFLFLDPQPVSNLRFFDVSFKSASFVSSFSLALINA